jgi:acetyl esterase/lipase
LYIKDHAKELGINSDQIMVGGESAGGGLTAAISMLARDKGEVKVAFQMPLYPMLDDRDTDSSRDNHAHNWNTKRNHKAWKRYLRDAYGTEIVAQWTNSDYPRRGGLYHNRRKNTITYYEKDFDNCCCVYRRSKLGLG